jgi:hypothetical protein
MGRIRRTATHASQASEVGAIVLAEGAMAENDPDDWLDEINPDEHGPHRWARAHQMFKEIRAGFPGAIPAAVADVARTPGALLGSDPAFIFLTAMGWRESYLPVFRKYGETHPIDPASTATPLELARVLGANAREAAKADAERVRSDPQAAIDAIEPAFAAAQAKAAELCRELVLAMEEFGYGNIDVAKERRDSIIAAWNALGRDTSYPRFPFPLLCEFCGKPLILIAKQRTHDGLEPARVHPECRDARKALLSRQRKGSSR